MTQRARGVAPAAGRGGVGRVVCGQRCTFVLAPTAPFATGECRRPRGHDGDCAFVAVHAARTALVEDVLTDLELVRGGLVRALGAARPRSRRRAGGGS